MAIITAEQTSPQSNPLDILEELVAANEWRFDRSSDEEMVVELTGRWCENRMFFAWQQDLSAMYFSCLFDLRVPPHKRNSITDLLAVVNEKLWLGHFDLCSDEMVPMFRHTVLLRGAAGASVEQLEDLVDIARNECERFYPAFQFVLWAGRSASEAVELAMLDTVGEAWFPAGPILLVGCGKMGAALLRGWLDRGVSQDAVRVVEPSPAALDGLAVWHCAEAGGLPADFVPRVVVLAVKPQVMAAVLPAYRRLVRPGTTFLSIAAGRTIASMAAALGADAAIVRSIPNTPAAVGRGITVACASAAVDAAGRALSDQLLAAVGEVAWVEDEALIDPVTAVSGNGPAYVFLLMECMAEAGRSVGLPADLAMRLARVTVSGAGELARQSPEPAAQLRRNVTSPGGTTEAALGVLMAADGIQPVFNRALAAAVRRARELAG